MNGYLDDSVACLTPAASIPKKNALSYSAMSVSFDSLFFLFTCFFQFGKSFFSYPIFLSQLECASDSSLILPLS